MLALVPATQQASPQQGPQPGPQSISPADSQAFSKVEGLGDGTRTFFMFRTSGHGYTIRADGFAERSGIGKGRPANFSLRVGEKGHIVRLYFLEHEGDLLLIYEASLKQIEFELGWGYVVRLNQKTLKTKWAAPVSDLNLGPGLVEGNDVYFSAANLLARMDLRTGAYVWQQGDVQRRYSLSLDGFQLPSITGDRVFFHEDGDKGKSIEIDKVTGKVLSVRDR